MLAYARMRHVFRVMNHLIRIKVRGPWDFGVWKEMLVPLSWDWSRHKNLSYVILSLECRWIHV